MFMRFEFVVVIVLALLKHGHVQLFVVDELHALFVSCLVWHQV